MGISSRHSSYLLLPAFLLLPLVILCSSSFNSNHFTQLFTSFSPFSLGETNHTTTPHFSLDAFLSTSMYKSSKQKTAIIKNKSNSERIEEDLARARAAILKAVQLQNFTSEKEEIFVPRGPIYRNAYAFYQSHTEMIKRFKVWTYREGELPLVHNGPLNNIYAIEGQFIDEMESKNNPFRACHPDEAHAPEVSHANPELFKHFIRVLCNANTSEGFRPKIDVSLPEIYLPFGKLGPPNLSQGPYDRSVLAFFAGSAHGYIRKILHDYWKDKDSEVQVHARLPKDINYTKMMGQSKFCLCPSGFEVASPREVEAIYAGCIPVIISDNYTLPFSDVLDWSQFSVQIPVRKIPEIKTILQVIPNSKYLKVYAGTSS
ncbi:hypothetical protein CRYUN_Cryun33cG0038900 [Craigia yunnanensis]